jgi:2-polyprenyl-3-methyl-5-hydroxy-6-metoxy-1,4-benzoquinol methylase
MGWLPNVTRRCRQPEIIDRDDLAPQLRSAALRGLERINLWSGSTGIVWRPLRALGCSSLRILDVATGAGDVPIRLWHRARRAGLAWTIDGCDVSADAVEHARKGAAQRGAEVSFFPCDVLTEALPEQYDAVMTSLFLHHLDEDQAIELLRRMARAARRLVLVNDLHRTTTGYTLAYVGTRLLSRSPVVHADGPRSVEGAFTIAEVQQLASRAGLAGAVVARRWPCRYLLSWQKT